MIPREVFEQTLLSFLEPVAPYLDDPTVSEIMINGPDEVYVERKGVLSRTEARFSSLDALMSAVRNLAQFVGRHVDEERPILEARLPDGSRVEAVCPPAGPEG
ncbi:MAG: ATPase, T2SS/T4P/T4SS family, partial [Myxococcota bacterium]